MRRRLSLLPPTHQVAFGVVVCFLVLFVNLDISPMYDKNVNRVANIALIELLSTLFLGLLLKVRSLLSPSSVIGSSKMFNM